MKNKKALWIACAFLAVLLLGIAAAGWFSGSAGQRYSGEADAPYHTTLLETWSLYTDRRPLLDHLKETLEKEGFVLKPRNLDEVYKKIVETGKDKYIYKLVFFMMNFIEQYKTTGYDAGGFEILRSKTDNPRTLLFLDIAEQVYHHYQTTLRQKNQIDFADMINDAHTYLREIEGQNNELP